MSAPEWLPGAVLACSFVPGVVIFFLPEESHRPRTLLNLGGALLKVALVGWMLLGPTLATAAAALAAGLHAGLPVSPLGWANLVASLEFAK